MATRSSSPPRTVLVLRTGSQPREDHERTTQEWVARRLAEALGWRYGGAFDPQRRPPPGGCYLVPDETLTARRRGTWASATRTICSAGWCRIPSSPAR